MSQKQKTADNPMNGMAPRYYTDESGNYLGSWSGGECDIPGSVEVNTPPDTADQKYVDGRWTSPPAAE